MGGIGSGGRRIGAGRKSKDSQLALVHGSRDRGTRPAVAVEASGSAARPEPVAAPPDLPVGQRVIWDRLAPMAIANGTLTAETTAGFAHLCTCIWVESVLLEKLIAEDWQVNKVTLQMDEKGGGLQQVEKKASDLITKWQAMLVRVENGLARFRLTGDGKGKGGIAVPKPQTALERLQAQVQQVRGVK